MIHVLLLDKNYIIISDEHQNKIYNEKNGISFLFQSFDKTQLIVKLQFLGIYNKKATGIIDEDKKLDLNDYSRFYRMKLWLPQRIKDQIKIKQQRCQSTDVKQLNQLNQFSILDYNMSNLDVTRKDNLQKKILENAASMTTRRRCILEKRDDNIRDLLQKKTFMAGRYERRLQQVYLL